MIVGNLEHTSNSIVTPLASGNVQFGTPSLAIASGVFDNLYAKQIYASGVQITGGGGGSADSVTKEIAQTGHSLVVGDVVRFDGTNYVKAQANSLSNMEAVGLVSAVAGPNNFTILISGYITGLSGLVADQVYFLSADTAGALTDTSPYYSKPMLLATSSTTGWVYNWRGTYGTTDLSKATVEIFETDDTYVKPSGAAIIEVYCVGGGGSGGGGMVYPGGGSPASGGGGGGGGAKAYKRFRAQDLSDTVSITIGQGGAGVAKQTDGNPGGDTTFGSYLTGYGGGGGDYATSATSGGGGGGSAGAGPNGSTSGVAGGAPSSVVGAGGMGGGGGGSNASADGSPAEYGGAGGGGSATTTGKKGGSAVFGGAGGGGGGSYSGGTYGTGGEGGGDTFPAGGGGAGGPSTNADGSNGADGDGWLTMGYGGGGGAAFAGNGGTGGKWGGGGGGGGGGDTGGGDGGSHGGAGGDGGCIVITWYDGAGGTSHNQLTDLQWSVANHTIDAAILPTASGLYNIGSPALPFASGYFDDIWVKEASLHVGKQSTVTAPSGILTFKDIQNAGGKSLADLISGGGGSFAPYGTIVMWHGSVGDIPTDWALCDGTNGTPDLRDKFIVGAGSTYDPSDTGGEATHTLTVDEMPAHTHTSIVENTTHVETAVTQQSHQVTSGSTGSAGGGDAHNNLPPYYALAYIMYVGSGGSASTFWTFGTWESKSKATTYYASTDGIVVWHNTSENYNNGYTDSSNPPTTLRAYCSGTSVGGYQGASMPVKKGDYWKVDGSGSGGVFWLPIISETASTSGKIVQMVNYQTGAYDSGSTQIPYDDTIPQNTEGEEFMTLAITPTNSSNKLRIDVVASLGDDQNNCHRTLALFQDSTADALAAVGDGRTYGGYLEKPVVLTHFMTAGTTSTTTFKVRAGLNTSGTISLNGPGGRRYGGVSSSSITITEISV